MTTNAAIAHSSTFARSGDGLSSGTMTALGGVESINGVSLTRDTIDATHMGSTGRYREFVPGLRNAEKVTIGIQFDADGTDYANAISDLQADIVGYYEVTFPDTSEWGFSGFLTEVNLDTPMDDKMMVELVYEVTGQPAFTAAA